MTTNSDQISEALGIDNTPESKQEVLPQRTSQGENPPVLNGIESPALVTTHQQEDYTISRDAFQDLIKTGNAAIENLAELAKDTESPRAYEALASMIKAVSSVSNSLYSHQLKAKQLNSRKEGPTTNIDKAVFVGNPADLLAHIKKRS